MKSEVEETHMAIMARFLNELNKEIQDVVEMHQYKILEDLIHQATKVVQQLKRRSSYRKPSTSWKDKERSKKEGTISTTNNTKDKESTSGKCMGKGHIASQCPNARQAMLMEKEDVVSESSDQEQTCNEDDEVEVPPLEVDLLMVRRILGSKNKEEDKT